MLTGFMQLQKEQLEVERAKAEADKAKLNLVIRKGPLGCWNLSCLNLSIYLSGHGLWRGGWGGERPTFLLGPFKTFLSACLADKTSLSGRQNFDVCSDEAEWAGGRRTSRQSLPFHSKFRACRDAPATSGRWSRAPFEECPRRNDWFDSKEKC